MKNQLVSYEESVHWLRSQKEHAELIKLCYLDEDILEAANRFLSSKEFAEVINILKLKKAHTKLNILDIGCGNGIASYAFASLGHDVSAVDPDISEEVGLGSTKRLASLISNGSLSTYQAFAEVLPFSDSTFDIIYARQALHHFADLRKGLAECSRVLKPKGILFATREHVINNEEQLETFLKSHILHRLHGGENAYPLKDYISALEQSKFKVLKCFAPFDTVINYFPTSNSEIKDWLFKKLKNKLGKVMAEIIIKLPYLNTFYRFYLSRTCNYSGRLYSFLCIKEASR